jgi:microcystin-dependent protein
MPYLTPDTASSTTQCWTLVFPTGADWSAIVSGALLTIGQAYNFEQFGTATPEETATVFRDMLDNAIFRIGTCRVIGEIVCFAGSASPDSGWLPCDGSSLLRADYPTLFAVIGTTYGSVDSTHFNLPDLRGRTVVDAGSGSGLSPRVLGDVFGEETHTLVTSEQASHSHADAGHTHVEGIAVPSLSAAIVGVPIPSAVPGIGVTGAGFAALGSSGGDGAHNNIQPSLALNYFIVAD